MILEEILDGANNQVYRLENGDLMVYSSSGRDAHFLKDGSFRGVIEKQYEKKTFSINTCSDLNYEGIVVDICVDNQRIAMINYDKGVDQLEIELLPFGDELSKSVFPLNDFLEILEKAKDIAIQCAKEDEEFRKKGIEF